MSGEPAVASHVSCCMLGLPAVPGDMLMTPFSPLCMTLIAGSGTAAKFGNALANILRWRCGRDRVTRRERPASGTGARAGDRCPGGGGGMGRDEQGEADGVNIISQNQHTYTHTYTLYTCKFIYISCMYVGMLA